MKKLIIGRKIALPVIGLIILSGGLYCRARDFNHDLGGHMIWRQAHVASNIAYFVSNGISLVPDMFAKNTTYKVFDFPLFQQIIAFACTGFGTPLVQTARACNILVYCLTFFTLWCMLIRCRVAHAVTALTLLLYTLSPLNIMYGRAVIPDNFALFLSFQSLLYFLYWDKKTMASWPYLAMVGTGVIATLIKNPVHLPVMCAIGLWFAVRSETRSNSIPGMIVLVLSIGGTVACYKLYANYINANSFTTPAWEFAWYFSTLDKRMQAGPYLTLASRFLYDVVYRPVSLICLAGIPLYVFGKKKLGTNSDEYLVMTGLLAGSLLTMLIFLNVQLINDYYQLPFVFITSFFSAWSIDAASRKINALIFRSFFSRELLAICFTVLFLAHVASTHQRYITNPEPRDLISAGKFIQAHTRPDSFILYVKTDDWDPSLLYFARREGYNIGPAQVSQTYLSPLLQRFKKSHSEFYAYFPDCRQYTDLPKTPARIISTPDDGCLALLDDQ